LERPFDVCATAIASGASFVARATAFEKNLSELIAEAILNDGFSLVDVWELCTSYYVPNNQFSKKRLEGMLASRNCQTGILHREQRPEYSRQRWADSQDQRGQPAMRARPLAPRYKSRLISRQTCVIAGAAGKKIISTATAFGQGAVLSGLWVSQANAYPVTVGTGYSTSTLILSPEEILYTGISQPDLMVVLFPEGLAIAKAQVKQLTADNTLYISASLLPVETEARKVVIDFERASGDWASKKDYWAIMALAEVLRHTQLYPLEALQESLSKGGALAKQRLAAVEASRGLIDDA